jgi:hypothetical protein
MLANYKKKCLRFGCHNYFVPKNANQLYCEECYKDYLKKTGEDD